MIISKQIHCTKAYLSALDKSKFLQNSIYVADDTHEVFICLNLSGTLTMVPMTMNSGALLGGINFRGTVATTDDLPDNASNGDFYLVGNETDGYSEYIYIKSKSLWEIIGTVANSKDRHINGISADHRTLTFSYSDDSTPLTLTLPASPAGNSTTLGLVLPNAESFNLDDDGLLSVKTAVFSYDTLQNKPTIDGEVIEGTMKSMDFLNYDSTTKLKDKLDSLSYLKVKNNISIVPVENLTKTDGVYDDTDAYIVLNGRAMTDEEKENTTFPAQWRTAGFFPDTTFTAGTQSTDLRTFFELIGLLLL